MIKVISNSDSLSTWYLDPGIPFGDGTQETPYYWDAVCDEDRTGISGTVSSSSHQYYKILLKSGTTYTFRYNKDGSWDGDMRISFYDTDGTTIKDSWDSDPQEQFDYTPTKDGLCTLRIQPYSSYSGSFKYLVTPAPEQFIGNPGWKKKEGLAQGDGWNKKTGKVFEYRTLEKANLKHNVFLQGLMYFDTNDFYSFSSPDVKNQTFKNGPIIVQRNLNLGDSEPTLLSGYSDYFCEKRKGYIYIAEAGSYTFSGQADDHGMLKLEDNEAYISWSGTKTYFTVNLEVGYHLIEYYHGEGGGGQITEVYWTTPSNSTATSIPAEVFFYSPKEYRELGGI